MISPDEALKRLIEGNERFARDESIHPNRCSETKNALIREQKPFAAVLSCSDSRVPIEIIFDAGLGDIFAVRTAGHVLSKEVMGSLEYAIKSLGVKLIVVLGHENCGAVKTAIESYKNQNYDDLSENLQSIMNHIYPAIENLTCGEDELHSCAERANILYQVEDLMKKDAYIAQKAQDGQIMVIGAQYSLTTGKVTLLKEKSRITSLSL